MATKPKQTDQHQSRRCSVCSICRTVLRPTNRPGSWQCDCLYNSLELSVSCRELAYVEGFAVPAMGDMQRPVAHSWCVDADGKVVDPTWDSPGREYCGLSLDKRLLYTAHQKGEPFGLVFNDRLFWEVMTGKRDWRGLLATGAGGFLPERELP